MKYLCLVYAEEEKLKLMDDDGCMAYDASLRKNGQCLASESLQRVQRASTVSVRNGKTFTLDSPFAETKEQLAGFYLLEARDPEEAVQMASKIPPAEVGRIEVRPIRELLRTTGERRPVYRCRDSEKGHFQAQIPLSISDPANRLSLKALNSEQ